MNFLSFMICTFFLVTANAANKSVNEISKEFNSNDFGYIYQITQDKGHGEAPFLITKKDSAEIGYELYSYYSDEPVPFADFKKELWEVSAKEAWDSDGSKYGEIDYTEALDYVKSGSFITDVDENSPEYKKAVKIFQQLKNIKDVIYIVAPVGATPCGDVTLPAVLIIDLKTGEAYNLSMDSSDC